MPTAIIVINLRKICRNPNDIFDTACYLPLLAEATRLISSAVAPNVISVKTAEMCFKRFRSDDYNLEDRKQSNRLVTHGGKVYLSIQ